MLLHSRQVHGDPGYHDPMYLLSVANTVHPGGRKITLKEAVKDALRASFQWTKCNDVIDHHVTEVKY